MKKLSEEEKDELSKAITGKIGQLGHRPTGKERRAARRHSRKLRSTQRKKEREAARDGTEGV